MSWMFAYNQNPVKIKYLLDPLIVKNSFELATVPQ